MAGTVDAAATRGRSNSTRRRQVDRMTWPRDQPSRNCQGRLGRSDEPSEASHATAFATMHSSRRHRGQGPAEGVDKQRNRTS